MLIRYWSSDVCASDLDFTALAEVARRMGARTFGPVSQTALLAGLALSARAAALKRANPDRADSIDADVNRLTSPEEMGVLFKALRSEEPRVGIACDSTCRSRQETYA